jgi:hypothetical protein
MVDVYVRAKRTQLLVRRKRAASLGGWRGRERSGRYGRVSFLPTAVEAGCFLGGCRGETPRTPPAAGEVAHFAHALGCTAPFPPPP